MKQTFFSLFFVIIALSGANAQPSILNESLSFKITTYNVEWFGCPNQGPSNEELQMNNVVKMILAMDSDVVALQEIGNTVMDTLVRRLGSEWGGRIVPNKADICGQNEAFLYRKSRVELVKAEAITQGVGTSYNWAYRFPILYQVNLLVDGNAIPVSFVNMHPKAMSDATSYG
ncbi:MAG: hypothetical protein LBU91_04710, partial [Bacteroidales bacterium]|nr:hypothetical protein [Bacteroidales bacterium]